MSLETQVQNLSVEINRRWRTIQARRDDDVRRKARDLVAKLAVGAWLLAANLLRVAGGNRVARQTLPIRLFQQRLTNADEKQLLHMLDHAVATVDWQLTLARRDRDHARRIEHLVADYLNTAEHDLAQLNQAAKT